MVDTTSHKAILSCEARVDRYLAQCVQCRIASLPLPSWPSELDEHQALLVSRVSFHGTALLLWEGQLEAAGWPLAARDKVRQEATAQSFWEQCHHSAIAQLIERMFDEGAEPIVTKGTAIAYSLYPKPALRRRGDTDIVVSQNQLAKARRALVGMGFVRDEAPQILQEIWLKEEPEGFAHFVDLHWRIDGSATVSSHLERGNITAKTVPLPALSPRAIGVNSLANLLLICLNRSEHILVGYIVGEKKIFGADRLIWAVDIGAICSSMTETDWNDLVALVNTTGTANSIVSGLEFARSAIGTKVPQDAAEALAKGRRDDDDLSTYLNSPSTLTRLRLEIAHSPRWLDKLKHLAVAAGPREEVLRERFPNLDHWPVAALRARRLVEGFFKAVKGQV